MKAFLCTLLVFVSVLPLEAQVGHDPAKSPYEDLEYSQELTPLFGWLRARHDPAGVAPKSAPVFGVRYELSLTGPLALTADLVHSTASRDVIEPTHVAAKRAEGTQGAGVTAVDVGFAMNLTGRKSWHALVPQVRAGLGFVSSPAKDDSSGFAFGTPFAFSLGGGLKFVPVGGRLQFRADVTDRIFKLSYPDSYYRLASDNTAVLPRTTASSFYTHHTAFTVGVSYRFAR